MEYRKHTNRNVDNYTPVEFTPRRNTLDRTHTSTKHDVIPSMPCITCDSLNWISVYVGQVIEKRGRKVLVIFGNVTTELRLFLFYFAILNSRALLQRSKADKSIRRRLSTAKFCQTKSIARSHIKPARMNRSNVLWTGLPDYAFGSTNHFLLHCLHCNACVITI